MTQEAGSKGRASGALTRRFVAPKKMYKHVWSELYVDVAHGWI